MTSMTSWSSTPQWHGFGQDAVPQRRAGGGVRHEIDGRFEQSADAIAQRTELHQS